MHGVGGDDVDAVGGDVAHPHTGHEDRHACDDVGHGAVDVGQRPVGREDDHGAVGERVEHGLADGAGVGHDRDVVELRPIQHHRRLGVRPRDHLCGPAVQSANKKEARAGGGGARVS